MYVLPSHSIQVLSRHWTGRLATYRNHLNDEHREALVAEALKFVGFQLESELSRSSYWADAPLARRVAVLLYLLDRGAVNRVLRGGRISFEASDGAEIWANNQEPLAAYLEPTLELLAALRRNTLRETFQDRD